MFCPSKRCLKFGTVLLLFAAMSSFSKSNTKNGAFKNRQKSTNTQHFIQMNKDTNTEE